MNRKRRHTRIQVKPAQLRKLDRPVILFGYMQDSPDWRSWLASQRFRRVTLRKALQMVEAGEAEVLTRQTDHGVEEFYKETHAVRAGSPTPATLTLSTMEAVRRRACGLRMGHNHREQVFKFDVWPEIGDHRAVAVRPRTTEAERQHIAKLIGPPLTTADYDRMDKQRAKTGWKRPAAAAK